MDKPSLKNTLYACHWLFLATLAAYPYTKKTTLLIYLACLFAFPLLKKIFPFIIRQTPAIAAFVFLSYMAITIRYSLNPHLGLHYFHLTADKLLLILVLPVLFLSNTLKRRAMIVFSATFLIAALLSCFSKTILNHTLLRDPEAFSATLAMCASFFLFFAMKQWRKNNLIALLSLAAFIFLGSLIFVFNIERIGYVCFIINTGIILFSTLKHKKAAIIAVIVMLALAISAICLSNKAHRISGVFNAITTTELAKKSYLSSSETRMVQYEYALKLWEEKPLFGYGYAGYQKAIQTQYPHIYTLITKSSPVPDRVENSYLFILVQTGIIGFLTYLALLILSWRYLQKNTEGHEKTIVTVIFSTYLVANLTAPQWINHYIAILLSVPLSVALANAFTLRSSAKKQNK